MSRAEVSLKEVATIVQGGRLKLSGEHFVENGYPAYGAGGLNGRLEQAEFDQSAVVLSSIGARCGKCFLAEGEWTSLANTQLIFPDPQRVDVRFLWYQLNDERRWHRSGSAQPFIKPSDVKSHQIYLPQLSEQRRIAAILDKADALRAKRREAVAKLGQLLQSVFLDMFGDPASNPRRLPVKPLGEICREIYRYPTYYGISYEPDGVPEIRGEMILPDGTIDPAKARYISLATSQRFPRTRLSEGDLVMSVRGTIGKIGFVSDDLASANITANLIRISPDPAKVSPIYLWRFAMNDYFASYVDRASSSTTIKTIKAPDLKAMPVVLPAMSEQARFIDVHSKLLLLLDAATRSARQQDIFFASLQHRAFTSTL